MNTSTERGATGGYNAAAVTFDDPANAFWTRFGRKTVERLVLRPGTHVLDVCCGSGASAIPAAMIVGPDGSVLGVDLPDRLLALRNIEFRATDMLDLGLQPNGFDAVVWWGAVLGTGYRGTVEQLAPQDRDRVQTANLDYIRSSGITSVVYAIGAKSAAPSQLNPWRRGS